MQKKRNTTVAAQKSEATAKKKYKIKFHWCSNTQNWNVRECLLHDNSTQMMIIGAESHSLLFFISIRLGFFEFGCYVGNKKAIEKCAIRAGKMKEMMIYGSSNDNNLIMYWIVRDGYVFPRSNVNQLESMMMMTMMYSSIWWYDNGTFNCYRSFYAALNNPFA